MINFFFFKIRASSEIMFHKKDKNTFSESEEHANVFSINDLEAVKIVNIVRMCS